MRSTYEPSHKRKQKQLLGAMDGTIESKMNHGNYRFHHTTLCTNRYYLGVNHKFILTIALNKRRHRKYSGTSTIIFPLSHQLTLFAMLSGIFQFWERFFCITAIFYFIYLFVCLFLILKVVFIQLVGVIETLEVSDSMLLYNMVLAIILKTFTTKTYLQSNRMILLK